MKIYDFTVVADDQVIRDMGLGDDVFRCRTNNDGSGLFIGSGNTQLLDNGHYPSGATIRQCIRALLIRRYRDNTRSMDTPAFRLYLRK